MNKEIKELLIKRLNSLNEKLDEQIQNNKKGSTSIKLKNLFTALELEVTKENKINKRSIHNKEVLAILDKRLKMLKIEVIPDRAPGWEWFDLNIDKERVTFSKLNPKIKDKSTNNENISQNNDSKFSQLKSENRLKAISGINPNKLYPHQKEAIQYLHH